MNDTERYLRGATRGLWGKEKRALRTELQGHIRIRTNELMLTGLSKTEAERQTLRELGAPTEVSRGMAGVYALQTAVKGTLVTSLLACAALLSIQQVQAQVQSVYQQAASDYPARAFLNYQLHMLINPAPAAEVIRPLLLELSGTLPRGRRATPIMKG